MFADQFAEEIPTYPERTRTAGGITGLAQVHDLRGDTSIEERARFDNRYIDQYSLFLDLLIALRTVGSLFRSKWGVAMFCVCLVPGIGRLVMLLILFGVVRFLPGVKTRIGAGADVTLDPNRVDFYLEPVLSVMPGMVFALLLTSLVTARAVARDRVTNALELFWTRGISPRAYVFAKWLGCTQLLGVFTTAVPLLLWVTALFLADETAPLWAIGPRLALALLGVAAVTGVWTGICVLVSAACAAPNTAMVSWSMLLVGSTACGVVLASALNQPWLVSCLSIWDAGVVVVREIAGLPHRPRGSVSSTAVGWPRARSPISRCSTRAR